MEVNFLELLIQSVILLALHCQNTALIKTKKRLATSFNVRKTWLSLLVLMKTWLMPLPCLWKVITFLYVIRDCDHFFIPYTWVGILLFTWNVITSLWVTKRGLSHLIFPLKLFYSSVSQLMGRGTVHEWSFQTDYTGVFTFTLNVV